MSIAMQQSDLISQHQLRRLYQMSIVGVYEDKLLNDIVFKMIYILSVMESTVTSRKLLADLSKAKTDNEKMLAVDRVIHKAHTSGFYAQHLVQGTDKVDIMNFLAEIAGMTNEVEYKELIVRLKSSEVSTVPPYSLYGTIDLTGFEDLNVGAIRDTRARFHAMKIEEYSFAGKTLLDIGCNVGHMLFEATTCGFPISYGLEQSANIVAAGNAIANYLRVEDYISILQADANTLTLDKLKELTGHEQFDAVFCFAIDGYIAKPEVLYRLLYNVTKETLYFEPNNHKITWSADLIKSWGFTSVEKIDVPYDKNTGSMRNCFICYK